MKRRRRLALVLAGVGLVGVAAVIALGWVASAQSDRLYAALGKGLGREVHAQRLGLTLRGGVGVSLGGVEIADDPSFTSAEPFLSAGALGMQLRVLPLFRRQLVVESIVIEEPVVRVVRDRSGRLNVDSLGGRERGHEQKPQATTEPRSRQRPAFQLGSLRLRHGTIRYEERASGRVFELSDVAVDARQPRWDAPIPVAVRAQLAAGEMRLDDISSEGVLDLAAERPTYRGEFTAGPGALGEVVVERLSAQIRAAPPAIDLDAAKAELLGGTLTGSAHVSADGAHGGITATVAADGVDLEQVPAPRGRPRPAGTLRLRGALAGPPPGPAFERAATGEGSFEVVDGRIEGAAFGRPILDALTPFLRAGVADRLRDRYPDVFASDDLRFTRLSGSGRLAAGRIRSEDFVLAAPSYEARGEGTLGLDGQLEATVRLAASPALTDDILGQERARATLVDSRGQLTVPLRVRGPVRRPHVSPDPAFAGTAARALVGGGLGKVAGDVLEQLLGPRRRRER